ncbi:MAG: bifunctional DNA-formamidopyrimidine glycosylase/DNA-(apurinic or apyrimidinic site) lyase [Candidatus Staskawiczbacteria bacterium]|nr:bifunctional DNA-formamidopyrimidine glycosylase/DNA-(apurinic or apyrimidinic site) lyase [Candidatus Staskawiczbacteria bacterium]
MPELPEVQTTVNGLQKKVLNRAFIDVWSDWKKLVKKPKDFELFKRELKGKKIKRVWRRAKNVILELSDGYSLLIHQKMTGHLMVSRWSINNGNWRSIEKGPIEDKINTFLHLIFFLDNKDMIALSDVRKFAKIELHKTDEFLNSKEFLKLGPEPLEKSFTFDKFKKCLKGKRGRVKIVLMKPEVIAGIGNIYASEALWWSKIHPEKDVSKLSEKELKNLYISIQKVLNWGIDLGGESFSDYRDVDGKKGNFTKERRVYKREGQNCQRCSTSIKRMQFGGRSAFFCPKCQKI